jgi:hypothetical protein
MKKMIITLAFIICLSVSGSLVFAQDFPPTWVEGPFPFGTEEVRGDAPLDFNFPDEMGTYHEYTAYKGTPIIDGDVENDDVWNSIPWTAMDSYTGDGGTSPHCYIFDGACDEHEQYLGHEDISAWFKVLWDDDHVYIAVKKYDNEYVSNEDHLENTGTIWQDDAYQLVLNTNDPENNDGSGISCETGIALLQWEEEAVNQWGSTPLELADGNSESVVEAANGKAIMGQQVEEDGYYTEVIEVAFLRWDEIIADTPQMFSIMCNDPDEEHEVDALEWGRGIFSPKSADEYASIVYSSESISVPGALDDITDLDGTIMGQFDDLVWPDGGSPEAENVAMLIDNNDSTKYLVKAEQSYIRYNISEQAVLTGYTMTSANDAPERDPNSWRLEAWDGVAGDWVTLHEVMNEPMWDTRYEKKSWSFENMSYYSTYRLVITAINGDTEGLMQIAELELLGLVYDSSDITDLGGTIVGSNDDLPWTGADSDGSPDGERIEKLIDNDVNTKYLVGAEVSWIDYSINNLAVVDGYTIYSANDAPERDPKSWELLGWDDATSAWVVLHTVTDEPMWDERFTPKDWAFDNTASYSTYRLNITAINGDADGLMQIAELELYGELGDIISTKVATNPVVVSDYQLDQNYPNPFNPTTRISFTLPEHANVSLVVYNTLGQRVKTLLDQSLSMGVHQLQWDGTNDSGQAVTNGLYFYTLRSELGVQTRKMMLMK